ncbi:MAG TPA: ABC transporter permease [Gaiellaceae bacterium]|nr:ABC transporter permease [Gaiellaceae bacterium]
MGGYVLTRLASSVVAFVAVTLFVFVAFYALPQNLATRRYVPKEYRLHGSVASGYARFVWQIVRHGDLGRSYGNREAVTTRLFRAAPVTLSLVAGGMAIWLILSLPLALLAALRPRSSLDRTITVLVLAGLSAQPLWLGLVLSWFFGHYLRVLPPQGYCSVANLTTGCDGLWGWATHLLLPWFTFAAVNAALFTLLVRGLLLEQLEEDYVRTARSIGFDGVRLLRAHVLKNVALPLSTMVGLLAATSLAGVVFVESAFDLPGLGGLLRQGAQQHDLPLTAGSVVFFALAIMVLNLVVDVAYRAFDPRLRAA